MPQWRRGSALHRGNRSLNPPLPTPYVDFMSNAGKRPEPCGWWIADQRRTELGGEWNLAAPRSYEHRSLSTQEAKREP